MKITKRITKKSKEKREIEIGEKGDFILIRARGSETYAFGKLENVINHDDSHGNPTSSIKFDGDSYLFRSNNIFGIDIPFFFKRTDQPGYKRYEYARACYFNVDLVEEAVSGVDDIITYLKKHPQEDQRKYADLVKRIKNAQK